MNYLAHFHLAGDDPAMVAGALLGDFVKGPLRGEFDAAIEQGIILHRRIDAISDADPELAHFRRQLPNQLRRYSGIITDIVFDHHLSHHWSQFHPLSLRQFADNIYTVTAQRQAQFPAAAQRFNRQMIAHDLLCQYGHWQMVDRALKSVARRLPKANPLDHGCAIIDEHSILLRDAFFNFYPRIVTMSTQLASQAHPSPQEPQ